MEEAGKQVGRAFAWRSRSGSRSAGSAGSATSAIVGLNQIGASAAAATIFEHFGFTPDRVTDIARRVVHEGLRGRTADP